MNLNSINHCVSPRPRSRNVFIIFNFKGSITRFKHKLFRVNSINSDKGKNPSCFKKQKTDGTPISLNNSFISKNPQTTNLTTDDKFIDYKAASLVEKLKPIEENVLIKNKRCREELNKKQENVIIPQQNGSSNVPELFQNLKPDSNNCFNNKLFENQNPIISCQQPTYQNPVINNSNYFNYFNLMNSMYNNNFNTYNTQSNAEMANYLLMQLLSKINNNSIPK